MPRRPARELLARLPLLGRLWRRYRTVTLYGETFCPGDFCIIYAPHVGDGTPTLAAIYPSDLRQAVRLRPCLRAEWAKMRQHQYGIWEERAVPLFMGMAFRGASPVRHVANAAALEDYKWHFAEETERLGKLAECPQDGKNIIWLKEGQEKPE